MRRKLLTMALTLMTGAGAFFNASAGDVYSLDSCRRMALSNNKEMMIRNERIRKADYQKQEAFAAYLPALDFQGAYFYNQKELSIFSSDQMLPTKTFDPATQSYQFNLVTDPATHMPIKGPDGQYIPETVALIPKEAMTYNIHNVFCGAVTLTQPLFMGGKIVAMNKITGYAKDIAENMRVNEAQNVVYAVDAAYWLVVSLHAKHELAVSYVNLLDSLDRNVKLMVEQGVATRSDLLSVDVKLNEANVDLLKVENGLSLSRMALAQVCGLPVDTEMEVEDEHTPLVDPTAEVATRYDMDNVYANRPDLKALELASKVAGQEAKVAMSSMLPNVALMGMYSFSNPNLFDGFKRRFSGAFSVGVVVSIPIWHWGGNYNKYRAAKTDETIMKLQVEDAKEMIDLQVSQAAYKSQEAMKTYLMTESNLDKAQENLRTAELGFREGVLTADDVMAAQTAWLKANSENIDATIEVQLCDVYLSKVLGTLNP